MHREERQPGRQDQSFLGLYNLHKSIFNCQLRPLGPCEEAHRWRKMLKDLGAEAVREALEDIPAGSHIAMYADSGPCVLKFRTCFRGKQSPALLDLLMMAKFRDEKATRIHSGWCQIAHHITPGEGRLLVGLRLLATLPLLISRSLDHC